MGMLLIADDHPLYRMALRQAIATRFPDMAVQEAADLDGVRAQLQASPDVELVLLDLHMPGNHGLVGLATLRAEFPGTAVAMLSAQEDPATVRRALALGACGYIGKQASLDELGEALVAIFACRTWVPPTLRRALSQPAAADSSDIAQRVASLSPQQLRVLQRVAEGRLNKQIADELGVQERTVKAHLTAIFEKLGVRNRTQAGVLLSELHVSARPSADEE